MHRPAPRPAPLLSHAPRSIFSAREEASVPRRFSAGELFVLVSIYCVVFWGLTMLDSDTASGMVCALFLTSISGAQALLFHGERPRAASIVAGGFTAPAIAILFFVDSLTFRWFVQRNPNWTPMMLWGFASFCIVLFFLGRPVGYLVGCATAGVFMMVSRAGAYLRGETWMPARASPQATPGSINKLHESPIPTEPTNPTEPAEVRVFPLRFPIQRDRPVATFRRTTVYLILLLFIFGPVLGRIARELMALVSSGIPGGPWRDYQLAGMVVLIGILLSPLIGLVPAGLVRLSITRASLLLTIGTLAGIYALRNGHDLMALQTPLITERFTFAAGLAGFLVTLVLLSLFGWLQVFWPASRKRPPTIAAMVGLAAFILLMMTIVSHQIDQLVHSPLEQFHRYVRQTGGSLHASNRGLTASLGNQVSAECSQFLATYAPRLDGLGIDSELPSAAHRNLFRQTRTWIMAPIRASEIDALDQFRGVHLVFEPSSDPINDEALGRLSTYPLARSVQALYLSQAAISPDGLRHLERFPRLQSLGLAGTNIDTKGIVLLAETCPLLGGLDVSDTDIDDSAVEALMSFKALRTLTIRNTRLSNQAKTQLRKTIVDLRLTD